VKYGTNVPSVETLVVRPLGGRQVLMRTEAAQTCYTTVDQVLVPGVPINQATIVGHGGVGIVEAVGPQVISTRVGDRVMQTKNDYGKNVIDGTGPFEFVEWVPGDHVTVKRWEAYPGSMTPFFKNKGKAYLDGINWKFIQEAASRALAIENGELDALHGPAPQDIDRLKKNGNLTVTQLGEESVWFIGLNFDRLEFETGSTALTPRSRAQITDIARILSAYPQVRVQIAGYTDNTGNEAANLALSRGRAEAVMNALRENGAPAANLTAEGFGSQDPIASNASDDGRAGNRRVTLTIAG